MNPLELIRGVRLITDVCLEVAPGETVLCIADRQENLEILSLQRLNAMRGAHKPLLS